MDKRLVTPIYYYTHSLTNKTISGPGLAPTAWTYAYGPGNGSFDTCVGCATSKTVEVTDPKGDVTRYTYGNRYFVSEGKLEQIDTGWTGSSALRNTAISYRAAGAGPYPSKDGTSDELLGDGGTDLTNRPEEQRTITQQGTTFTWRADEFDTMARATKITRSSSLGHIRTNTTLFKDNLSKWVIGQVERVTESSGLVPVLNEYDAATANLLNVQNFGKLQRKMTYNTDGTLNTLADGKSQVTTFSDYKRGIAQTISYPNSTKETAVVSDIAKISSLSTVDVTGQVVST